MRWTSKGNLTLWFKQPLVLISMVFMLMWCLFDTADRFFYDVDGSDIVLPITSFSELPVTPLTDEQIGEINALFLNFFPEPENETLPTQFQGLTAEQQAAQEGELNEVFIDNKKLQLKAIIVESQQQEKTALINIADIMTGEQELKAFTTTSKIHDFDLHIINNSQVLLTAQRGENLQRITLSMFKASRSNSELLKANK